jgi:hypothetical protein
MASSQMNEMALPLDVVDGLFHHHVSAGHSEHKEFGVYQHFGRALSLDDEERFAAIPCLNDANGTHLKPGSLVRFRCLVQDTFDPEMFNMFAQERDESNGNTRLITTKFRECVTAAPGKVLRDVGTEGYSQRGVRYCVPIPGEVDWARSAAAEWTQAHGQVMPAATQPAGQQRQKRGLEDADMSRAEMLPPPVPVGAPRKQRATRAAMQAPAPPNANLLQSADDFGLNFPIREEEQHAGGATPPCIVKLYDHNVEALKLCDSVEILGILCVNPELASFGDRDESLFWDARNPSPSRVPRLHALFIRPLPFHNPLLPFTQSFLTDERLAKVWQHRFSAPGAIAELYGIAVQLLSSHLGGDSLAAQYVLMQLVSRSFARHGDELLGSWSLNLAAWPTGLEVSGFVEALKQLAPRVLHHELTVDSLNNGKWRPQKDYDANRLVAGRLQVASGTVMVFDETKLSQGQLHDAGVRNLAAIRALICDRTLSCDCMGFDVKLPLEVQAISVSGGRSFIPEHDVLLPLRPAQAVGSCNLQPAALDAIRLFVAMVTRCVKPAKIPDEVVQRFGEDFAKVRTELHVKSELCGTWMSLARAFCLAHGETALTLERWRAVLDLESERLRRCKENNYAGN